MVVTQGKLDIFDASESSTFPIDTLTAGDDAGQEALYVEPTARDMLVKVAEPVRALVVTREDFKHFGGLVNIDDELLLQKVCVLRRVR